MQPDSFDQIYQSYFDSVYRYADLFQSNAIPGSIPGEKQPEKLALRHCQKPVAVRAAKEKDPAD